MPTRRAASAIAEPEAPEIPEDVAPADSCDSEPDASGKLLASEEPSESALPASLRMTHGELLNAVEGWKQAGKSIADMAFAAGYVTVTEKGQERVLQSTFNKALLEAQGLVVGPTPRLHPKNDGHDFARVTAQGQILVSQLATREVNAVPGAVFAVEYPEPGVISLRLTDQVKPIVPRKKRGEVIEKPGTPLLDGIASEQGEAPAE